jgi:hypothetical protein
MTERTEYEDARGNRACLVRRIPSWGVSIEIVGTDGTRAELDLDGDQLLDFAEAMVAYAKTFTQMQTVRRHS